MPVQKGDCFQVGKTQVCIIDRSVLSFPPGIGIKEEFRALLLAKLGELPALKKFPRLQVIIENWDQKGISKLGYCSAETAVARPETPTVNLCIDVILSDSAGSDRELKATFSRAAALPFTSTPAGAALAKRLDEKLDYLMRHELTHLLHFQKARYAEKLKRWTSLLAPIAAQFASIQKDTAVSITEATAPADLGILLAHSRALLTYFTDIVWTEGIAELFGEFPDFSEETFLKHYGVAKRRAEELADRLLNIGARIAALGKDWKIPGSQLMRFALKTIRGVVPQVQKLDHEIQLAAYPVGFHMLYTIVYAYQQDLDMLESFMKASRRDRFYDYEACCKKLGIRPIFTFDSGKGIIDYARLAADIARWADQCGIAIPSTADYRS
jgi:hypothetical protein